MVEAERLKDPYARVTRQSTAAGRRSRPGDHLAIMLGRTLAVCVHPFAAWPLLSMSWRLLILTAYAVAGYVTALGALFVLRFA